MDGLPYECCMRMSFRKMWLESFFIVGLESMINQSNIFVDLILVDEGNLIDGFFNSILPLRLLFVVTFLFLINQLVEQCQNKPH